MICGDIKNALADFLACEETPEGSRVATHCLYPSFEHVRVFVAKIGDGYTVHDGAGAYSAAWLHGREEDLISKCLIRAAEKFRIFTTSGNALAARVTTVDWLASGILTVANASSIAAHDAVERIVAAQEEALIDKIGKSLHEVVPPNYLTKNVNVKGISGGTRHFDFIIARDSPQPIFVNSVTPRRNSISAKYVSFADTGADKRFKLAVHDRELETGDTALLQQVASVVPLGSLAIGARRSLENVTNIL